MPEMTLDLIYALALLGVAVVVASIYGLRVLTRGKSEFDRVNKQGGSALLGKDVMQGAYWSLQPVARLLTFLKITPNMVSWSSFAFALAAGACLCVGHFGFGAVFATISAFLDTLDGMVARLTGVSSDAGEVLDAAVDRYAEFFFLGGLIIYYREIPILLGVTLVALMGSFMVSYSSAKAEALQVSAPKGNMRRPERAVYLTLGALFSPITIPFFEQVRPYGIAIGHPMVAALGLVAVMSNISAAERLWAIARAVRVREAEQARAARTASSAQELCDEQDAKAPAKSH
jgi:phosphatidylglycerophosphate synthase